MWVFGVRGRNFLNGAFRVEPPVAEGPADNSAVLRIGSDWAGRFCLGALGGTGLCCIPQGPILNLRVCLVMSGGMAELDGMSS